MSVGGDGLIGCAPLAIVLFCRHKSLVANALIHQPDRLSIFPIIKEYCEMIVCRLCEVCAWLCADVGFLMCRFDGWFNCNCDMERALFWVVTKFYDEGCILSLLNYRCSDHTFFVSKDSLIFHCSVPCLYVFLKIALFSFVFSKSIWQQCKKK